MHGTGSSHVALLEQTAQMLELEKEQLHARLDQQYFYYTREGSQGDGNGWHQHGDEE